MPAFTGWRREWACSPRDPKSVVLAMTWLRDEILVDAAGRPLDNRNHAALVAAIDDLAASLRKRGLRVVLVGPVALPRWPLASEVSRNLAYGRAIDRPMAVPRAEFEREFALVFRHFTGRKDLAFARPDEVLCDATACSFVAGGRALFSDDTHLAAAEVGRLRGIFRAALE